MTKGKTVSLLPVSRKRVNGPVRLCVPYSVEMRKLNHGIPKERLQEFETLWKEGGLDKPDEHYYFIVPKGGMSLQLKFPADEQQYWVALANKSIIATSRRDAEKNPNCLFYVHDEEEEADYTLDVYTEKVRAYASFSEMNVIQKRRFLRLYGLRTDSTSDKVIEKKLIEFIEASPKKFNKFFQDPNLDQRMMLAEFVEYGIIIKSGPVYKYGEDVLGADEEQTIAYIKNPKHSALISQFVQLLNEKKDIKSVNA